MEVGGVWMEGNVTVTISIAGADEMDRTERIKKLRPVRLISATGGSGGGR